MSLSKAQFIFILFTSCSTASAPANKENILYVFLGVSGYGTADAADKDNFEHHFSVKGEEVAYKVSNKDNYAINNVLTDPDGYAGMSAEEILKDLFGEM